MRVLTVGNMFPPHHLGGYELMWRSSVRHLRDAGDEVRVLTTDHRRPDPDPTIPEDPDVHRELRWYWRDHEFPRLSLHERLAIERHNLAVLGRQVDEFRPAAIAWWAMGGMSLSLLDQARRLGLPAAGIVVDEWMAYARDVDGWERAFGRRGLAPVAAQLSRVPTGIEIGRAARWLFVSEYLRRRALDSGIDVGESTVAHGGVEAGRFAAAPEHEWEGRLICLGRIDPRKGLASAIRALAELPGCSLRCIGDGDPEHLRQLRRLAREQGVGERVGFARVTRDRVQAELATADVLVFPVVWPEPFGLVPLEAMTVGTPVIATATGGSAEYLADGENCLVASAGEPSALAAAVARLAGDRQLRLRLRAGGLATAALKTEGRFNEAVRARITEVAA